MRTLFIGLLILCSLGCARIPVQSVGLMQQIHSEGERMHKLNVAYVNRLFNEKLEQVNLFIQNEYTPDIINNIKATIKANNINMNENWEVVFARLTPVINGVKDSLTRALEQTRQKILSRLNDDYQVYAQACETQVNLLSSAVKINEASRNAANTVMQKISGNKLDLGSLETILDKYLKKGEYASNMILTLYNDINKNILHTI